jgi:hypothetical protein
MDGTILGQGSFTQGATATSQIIMVPSNLDWLRVYNFTQASATGGNSYMFYWQRGMPSGKGIMHISGGAHAVTVNTTAANSFTLYDPSLSPLGSKNNGSTGVSGFTAANPAVVTVGSTTGLAAGNIVRFDTLNNQGQYGGIDFSVGYGTLTGTTFSVDYLNATDSTASTTGNWRIINFNPLFYPRRRIITIIATGNPTVVTLSVDHGFTVGQQVRFSIKNSSVWGTFTSLDGVVATITAVDTATGVGHNSITLNVDSTALTGPDGDTWADTFAEIVAGTSFTPGEIIPVGEDTAFALSSTAAQSPLDSGPLAGLLVNNANTGILADSTVNTGFLGMILTSGSAAPAGVASDQVFWVAGKSTFGGL